jgi:hypothetical protein
MQSLKWNSYGLAAAALGLGFLLAGTPRPAAAQDAQAAGVPVGGTSPYLVLVHHSPDQISADDSAILRSRQTEIVREAAMFGYDLTAGHWTYDQAVCPDIPQAIVLHERSVSRSGLQSLFTAVVPRGEGRVWVVPILYRGATPFQSAIGSERMLSVFNHAVPADIAKQAVEPDGHWLALAMTFAEIAGAEPRVPQNPDVEAGLLSAPPPTLHVSQLRGALEIQFTGREAPRQYTVWSITVNGAGRALAAEAQIYPERIYAENASAALPPAVPIQPAPASIPQPATAPPAVESPKTSPAWANPPVAVQPTQPVVEQPGAAAEPAPAPAAAPAQPAAAPAVQSAEVVPPEPAIKEKKVKEKKVRQKNSDEMIEPKVRELPDLPDPAAKPLPY